MSAIEIKVGQLGINYLVDGSNSGNIGMFELAVHGFPTAEIWA